MSKLSITVLFLVSLTAEGWCGPPRFIQPTYRPPRQQEVKIRYAREVQPERADYIPQHFGIPAEEDSKGWTESATQNYNKEDVLVTDNLDSLTVQSIRYQSPEEELDQTSHYHQRSARNVDRNPVWRTPSTGQQPRRPVFMDDIRIPNRRYARGLRDSRIPQPWGPPNPTFPRPGRGPFNQRFKRDFQYPKWNPHGSSGPWHKNNIPSRRISCF